MEEAMPEIYAQLNAIQKKLEKHYHDMQDMEFTVQDGKLWFLQTRNGKRTGTAMVKIAMDLLKEGEIDEKTAILRCEPNKLDELLHPVFDKEALLDHYHDIVSEITKHDLILNRGASLELERIYLSDVSSDVRTNGGWGKLYKEVSGKELNESGFGTVKICDGLYGIKDGLFNIYSQSNKECGINEF